MPAKLSYDPPARQNGRIANPLIYRHSGGFLRIGRIFSIGLTCACAPARTRESYNNPPNPPIYKRKTYKHLCTKAFVQGELATSPPRPTHRRARKTITEIYSFDRRPHQGRHGQQIEKSRCCSAPIAVAFDLPDPGGIKSFRPKEPLPHGSSRRDFFSQPRCLINSIDNQNNQSPCATASYRRAVDGLRHFRAICFLGREFFDAAERGA